MDKSNFIIDVVLLSVSIILFIFWCFNLFGENVNEIELAISMGIIPSVIISFLYERVTNKKLVKQKVDEYNKALIKLYETIRKITGYTLVSEGILLDYALNTYSREKGYSVIKNPELQKQVCDEIREMYKDKANEIPFARPYVKSISINYFDNLTDIEKNLELFLSNYQSIISETFNMDLKDVDYWCKWYKHIISNYINGIFTPDVYQLDTIIVWAREKTKDNFILDNYMAY